MARRRRVIKQERNPFDISNLTKEEWRELIIRCLTVHTAEDRVHWGCLGKDKMLFRIITLDKVRTPNSVIFKLKKEGRLVLDEDTGFYKYIKPRQKRVI